MMRTTNITCLTALVICAGYGGGFAERFPGEKVPRTFVILDIAFQHNSDIGGGAENGCAARVLRRGLQVVDSQRADITAGTVHPNYRRIGRTTGADVVITGAITQSSRRKGFISARAISTRTARVLASAEYRGRLDKAYKIGEKVCDELLSQLDE